MSGADGARKWSEAEFQAAHDRAATDGSIRAPGVEISAEHFAKLVAAAPKLDPDRPGYHLVGPVTLHSSTLTGDIELEELTFVGDAGFAGVTFSGAADLSRLAFVGAASFEGATFCGSTTFDGSTFAGPASFSKATFSGDADFGGTTFTGSARFEEARFRGSAEFVGATFHDSADFRETIFTGDAHFDDATFERARELGPMGVFDRLWLDKAVFSEAVRIEASARRASFARAVFRAGADVRLRWAQVWLEDADFAESSLLAALPARLTPEATQAFLGWEQPGGKSGIWCMHPLDDPPPDFEPRVLSARGARLGALTLSGLNLSACHFAGAHGLDKLRLERVQFSQPPGSGSDGERRWWTRVRWTRRQIIAEEREWRGWRSPGEDSAELPPYHHPWPPEPPETLAAEQIAAIYRALRKAHEDSKDEPGAADFYYGEMEMRRHGGGEVTGKERVASWAERLILWLYWLVSGYGLRASRAVIALFLVVAMFTSAFYVYGFRDRSRPYATAAELQRVPSTSPNKPFPPPLVDVVDGWGSFDAWTYSAGTATAVVGAPDTQLTEAGRAMRIPLRVLGPILIGLALLSIRGRVKR